MTFALKRKALTIFKNKFADKSTVRHNVVQWLKAVEYLGSHWILAESPKLKKIRKVVKVRQARKAIKQFVGA